MILTHKEITDLVNRGGIQNPGEGSIVVDLVSVTLHLSEQFTVYDANSQGAFTPPLALKTKTDTVEPGGHYPLQPMGRVLACSREIVEMPLDLMGFIQTKGCLARGFLVVHMCDGQIDPGYRGKITFEIVNLSEFHYLLVPGMPVANLFFHKLVSSVQNGYEGRYQNSDGPTPMKPVDY